MADPTVLGVYKIFAITDSHVAGEIIIVNSDPVKVERVGAVSLAHRSAPEVDGNRNDLWVNTTDDRRTWKSESGR